MANLSTTNTYFMPNPFMKVLEPFFPKMQLIKGERARSQQQDFLEASEGPLPNPFLLEGKGDSGICILWS